MIAAIIVPIAALANRHRGGWLPTGHTQIARLDFAAIMTALVLWRIGVPVWWIVPALLAGWFIGCLAGQGEGMWIGRASFENRYTITPRKWLTDAANLTGSGLCNVAVPVALLWWFGALWWPLLIAGALKPLAYELGWRMPLRLPGFSQGPELGEVAFGAALGAAILTF